MRSGLGAIIHRHKQRCGFLSGFEGKHGMSRLKAPIALPSLRVGGTRRSGRLRAYLIASAATTMALSLAPGARASTIPAAEYVVYAGGANSPAEIMVPGSLSNSACTTGSEGGCENSLASASATGFDVSTSGSTSGGTGVANAAGQGSITVYYEIEGPATVPVPLIISGNASTSASGPDAEALAYIEYGDGDLYTCSSTVSGPCGSEAASGSLNSVEFSNQDSNTLYDMQVITTGSSTLGSGSFAAQISGVSLSIAPSFLAANPGYTLEFSGNVTPVPLPAAVWLLLAGVGILCLASRQRGCGRAAAV